MIKDREVDLTVEHKFYTPDWIRDKRYTRAKERISTGRFGKRTFIDIDPMIGERLTRRLDIPWIKKASEVKHLLYKRNRFCKPDDEMSLEFACIVRSTSSNTLMFFGEHAPKRPEIIEDVFLETIGYIPFTAMSRCYRCGARIIAPHNSVAFWCEKCEAESRGTLPWQRISI